MKYQNLILVGTSHIAKESISEVEKVIVKEIPEVVALELDRKRLFALLHPQKAKASWRDVKRIGLKGYLFSLIGAWVERKLGDKVGVKPGAEMLSAIHAAKKVNAKIALVDQDIEITLRRFSKCLSWKERWNFLVDLVKGIILRKNEFNFDLNKVPSEKLIQKMIKQVKVRYPNIYRVLVTERNAVMAHRLAHLMKLYPDKTIVAVVGAGHGKDIIQLVKQAQLS